MTARLTKELAVVRVTVSGVPFMLRRTSALVGALAAAQAVSMSALPGQAAVNCGAGAHWVHTGPGLGAGYCKKNHHHKHDHYVCALGYHFVGNGRCVRNGKWWTGNRPVEWGPYYEPQNKSGSVSFQGPNGGEIKFKW